LTEVKSALSGEPLVSLIIPAYNAAAFIERTLNSARAQTHANLEIIVVDDGSTDSTRELVLKAIDSDSRIRIVSTANQGVAAARNTGIAEAAGPYLAFLDADDLWHPCKIEKQVALLGSLSRDWGGVYALYSFIDEEDRVMRNGGSRTPHGYIYARHLSFKFIGNGSTLLVRREAIDMIGGFDPSYAAAGIGGCEDLDFELKLFARFKAAAIAERLVGYREYAGNMSSDHSRMARAMTEVVERSIHRGPQLNNYAKNSARALASGYAMIQLSRSYRFGAAAKYALALAIRDPMVLMHRLASYLKFVIVTLRRNKKLAAGARGPHFLGIAPERVPTPRDPVGERRRMQLLALEDARIEASLSLHPAPNR
jgi:hypothetical protein